MSLVWAPAQETHSEREQANKPVDSINQRSCRIWHSRQICNWTSRGFMWTSNYGSQNCDKQVQLLGVDVWMMSPVESLIQQASTDGDLCEAAVPRTSFEQSFPSLSLRAAKNFSFHRPAVLELGVVADVCFWQLWSAGDLCLRQTLTWQILQVLVLEKVRVSLHRLTGHLGFFFLEGSQDPDFRCFSIISRSSFPSFPVVSIEAEQASHTITFLLIRSDSGHSWSL